MGRCQREEKQFIAIQCRNNRNFHQVSLTLTATGGEKIPHACGETMFAFKQKALRSFDKACKTPCKTLNGRDNDDGPSGSPNTPNFT